MSVANGNKNVIYILLSFVSKLHIVIDMKLLREKINIFFCWYGHSVVPPVTGTHQEEKSF